MIQVGWRRARIISPPRAITPFHHSRICIIVELDFVEHADSGTHCPFRTYIINDLALQ